MDDADRTDERDTPLKDARVAEIRAKAFIPTGKPGDCDLCGEWSGRLIHGLCAPCRDKWHLS